MKESRYRLRIKIGVLTTQRDIMLASNQPVIDILNWLEDEYDFRARLKKAYLVRDDGSEEQVY